MKIRAGGGLNRGLERTERCKVGHQERPPGKVFGMTECDRVWGK